jgi:CDP-4-dehydro-6-deoxyglucose reductase, E3
VRVSVAKSGLNFSVAPDEWVLDAALAAGLNLPHSCKGGNCGSCRARLLTGEVRYPAGPPLGLSEAEVADGFILLCRALALSDLTLETFEVRAAGESLVKRLPARIARTQRLSHDVLALHLRLPAAETFVFEPGQYLDILLPGGRRRSFSIASPPHDSRLLELHVRRVAGGELTERLFDGNDGSSLLSVEGPLGRFVYRHGSDPMLLIGGGTGWAPLKSIVRHVIEQELGREMHLYWGVRSERDLYARDELEALASCAANFHYTPVLSEPDAKWTGRRGWVHEAVLHDIEALDRYDTYASGPPAMIEAVREAFLSRNADLERLYFDSFDYAPDTLERQRAKASTRS